MKYISGIALTLICIAGCESSQMDWRVREELSRNLMNINQSIELLAVEIWKTNRKVSRLSRKLRRESNE